MIDTDILRLLSLFEEYKAISGERKLAKEKSDKQRLKMMGRNCLKEFREVRERLLKDTRTPRR